MREAILQKVETYIKEHELLSPRPTLIVGLSGGADSVALLHILHQLQFRCIAAHCNFHLRGEESNRDAHFVAELCQSLNIIVEYIDFDTNSYAAQQKISIEMAARELRYDWFENLRQKHHAQAIAIAHHADDSIETMLLNLTRGTGLKGLTGMKSKNSFVVRPMLCCTRKEVEQYLAESGLRFVTDSTNALCDYKRNKIRNQFIPLLEEINPSVRATLYSTLERLDSTYSLYHRHIAMIRQEVMLTQDSTIEIKIEKLIQLAGSEKETVLFELLNEFGFNSQQVRMATQMLTAETGKILYSASHSLLKNRACFVIEPVTNKENNSQQTTTEHNTIPNGFSIRYFDIYEGFRPSRKAHIVHLDADKLKHPLTFRHWKLGDRFVPFGMKQSKKLSDFFTDIKLSKNQKEKVLILLSQDTIAWVVGYRTDNRFCIDSHTRHVVEISTQA